MIGIIGKILGSDKVLSKGMELIDSMHTSETEAIEAKTAQKVELLKNLDEGQIVTTQLAKGKFKSRVES